MTTIPLVSVITATLNSRSTIPDLVQDLNDQNDSRFKWVVVDGGSNDGTVDYIRENYNGDIEILVSEDFGIYDALNRGVLSLSTDYYLVVGSDDRLFKFAIETINQILQSYYDIVVFSVQCGSKILRPNKGKSWLRGHTAFVASHTVGTVIKTSLHKINGMYSKKFPIAADQLFLKKILQRGNLKVKTSADVILGRYGTNGVSHSDYFGNLCEFTRVQLDTEKYKSLQILIFMYRLLRNINKVI